MVAGCSVLPLPEKDAVFPDDEATTIVDEGVGLGLIRRLISSSFLQKYSSLEN